MKKTAVIDLGTNTFNMLVAEESGHAIYKEKVPVKLGKGGISKGEIAPDAYERALKTLLYFKEKAESLGAGNIVAIATSAMRSAKNGPALCQEVLENTGIDIQTISGDHEAEYIYFGVKKALDLGNNSNLIIDIGGGSVEFIIGDKENLNWKQSFEIGAQRLLDKFHQNDPITSDEVNDLKNFLSESLNPLFEAAKTYNPDTLVGSSGTFDTLAEIDIINKKLSTSYEDTTEYTLQLEDFRKISKSIIGKTRSERMEIPGMVEMRVDMIVVACLLIDFIISKVEIKNLRISSYALKEGVLHQNL